MVKQKGGKYQKGGMGAPGLGPVGMGAPGMGAPGMGTLVWGWLFGLGQLGKSKTLIVVVRGVVKWITLMVL